VGPRIRVNSRDDRDEVGKLVLVDECAANGFHLRLGWMLGEVRLSAWTLVR